MILLKVLLLGALSCQGTKLVSGEDCFDHKIEYFGNGIGQPLQAANPSDCQEKCQKNAECSYWTFLSGESCQLKTSDGGARRNNLAISGPKNCPKDLDKMQREYCAMSLDEKRAFLAGSETTASEAEELLNFVSVCTSGGPTSCQHSAVVVLDDAGADSQTKSLIKTIEDKIQQLCDGPCQELNAKFEQQLETIEIQSEIKLTQEKNQLAAKKDDLTTLYTGLARIEAGLNAEASALEMEIFQNDVRAFIENSNLPPENKKELIEETAKENGKNVKEVVKAKQGQVENEKKRMAKVKVMFKKKIATAKKLKKVVTNPANFGKAVKAGNSAIKAYAKFSAAQNADGSIDPVKVVGGVIDVVDGLGSLVGPPMSAVTGVISQIFSMFTGTTTPSTKEIIEKEFKKQKKFIEEEFNKQYDKLKNLMTLTQLEMMKSQTLGTLDALQARYEFLLAYEGIGSCLSSEDVAEITERVEYFLDQKDAFAVKHSFDQNCPKVLVDAEALDSQTVCGFLLSTYLLIEEKRFEILTIMISLLSTSEEYKMLNHGYDQVFLFQKNTLSQWLESTFSNETTYCGLFHYHDTAWKSQQQKTDVLTRLKRASPSFQQMDCQLPECYFDYNYEQNDLKNIKNTRNVETCHWQCTLNPECNYWTFNKADKTCYLKYAINKVKADSAYTSGPKKCMTREDIQLDKDDGNTDGGCLERNIDYNGDDLDEDDYEIPVTQTGLTAWQCRLLCQETEGCKYFTHAKHLYNIVNGKMTITDNKCFLKWGMGTRTTKLEGAGFTSGAAFCPASNGTCLQYNVDFKGGSDIKGVENVIDATACQKKCQQTQDCTFFTYQKSLKKCHLKSGQADSDRRTGKADLISGPRYCACGMWEGEWNPWPAMLFESYKNKAPNVESCQKICQTRPCKGWNFDFDTLSCYIFKHTLKLHLKNYFWKVQLQAWGYNSYFNPMYGGPKYCP